MTDGATSSADPPNRLATPAALSASTAPNAEDSDIWRFVYACRVGTSHVGVGVPCQDAARVELIETTSGPVLITASADGAGSAERSAEGAEFACQAAIGEVRDWIERHPLVDVTETVIETWVLGVHAALHELAREAGQPSRAYASTLLLAVVGPRTAAFAHIGDGVIVTDDGTEHGYEPVFWPRSGEYANATYFVVEAEALRWLQKRVVHERTIRELALLSDGLQTLALAYSSQSAHAPFFQRLFAQVRCGPGGHATRLTPAVEAFLGSEPVNARTDDDKTLVLATRRV